MAPKVLVIHTLPPMELAAGRITGEFDLHAVARGIAACLPGEAAIAGVRGTPAEMLELLDRHRPEVVFNACEAPLGRPELEAHVAALLEWAGIRFTGARSETLALCRRKDRTRAVLAAHGVPVPPTDGFPCIVKPMDDDGSAGMDPASICRNAAELAVARRRLPGRVLVERFLPGREFAVALWGRTEPDHASIGETIFYDGLQLITYAAKWDRDHPDFDNAVIQYDHPRAPALEAAVLETARAAWRAVEGHGYLRIDIRLDEAGEPFVLDVNPNPEVGPWAGMCRAVQEAGWRWEDFIRRQVEWA